MNVEVDSTLGFLFISGIPSPVLNDLFHRFYERFHRIVKWELSLRKSGFNSSMKSRHFVIYSASEEKIGQHHQIRYQWR